MNAVADRWQNYLWRKGETRNNSPRGQRTVIGSIGNAASEIIEKTAFDALKLEGFWPRPFAGCDPPAMFAIASELARIFDGVALLNISGAPAVLEVIDALVTHERVLDAAKIDPDVGKLVCEK